MNLGPVFVIDCDSSFGIVTVPGTTITTPNYPNIYGPDLDCQVTVTFKDRVLIIFDYFYLEPSSTCSDDWLEVHDGDNSDSELIGEKLCGHDFKSPMESSGISLTLVFHSDGDRNYTGFKIITHQGAL